MNGKPRNTFLQVFLGLSLLLTANHAVFEELFSAGASVFGLHSSLHRQNHLGATERHTHSHGNAADTNSSEQHGQPDTQATLSAVFETVIRSVIVPLVKPGGLLPLSLLCMALFGLLNWKIATSDRLLLLENGGDRSLCDSIASLRAAPQAPPFRAILPSF